MRHFDLEILGDMNTANPHNRVPPILADLIFSGRCVLFVGSGASVEAGAPTSAQLAKELADRYLDSHHQDELLARVAAYIEHKPGLGRRVLLNHIVNRLSSLLPRAGDTLSSHGTPGQRYTPLIMMT